MWERCYHWPRFEFLTFTWIFTNCQPKAADFPDRGKPGELLYMEDDTLLLWLFVLRHTFKHIEVFPSGKIPLGCAWEIGPGDKDAM